MKMPDTQSSPENRMNMPDAIRQLADEAQILTWLSDANDDCRLLNQSATFGKYETGRFQLSEWTALIHPDDLQQALPVMHGSKHARIEYRIEYRIVRTDGTVRWMMETGTPCVINDGALFDFIHTIVDVTDKHDDVKEASKREAGYRLLAQYASDVIGYCTTDGTLLYVSPSTKQVLGYSVDELIGRNWYAYIHPEDSGPFQEAMLSRVETGRDSSVLEYRVLSRSGIYVWLGAKFFAILDPASEEHFGTVILSRDATYERKFRNELQQQESRYRSLMRLSTDWYWETDEDNRFTFVSGGVEKLIGTTRDHLIGKEWKDIAADLSNPGLQECYEKFARRAMFQDIRYVICDAVGERHVISVAGEPEFDSGIFKGYRGVSRDVTKKMALAEENKSLVEQSLDIIALFDSDGRFLRVNKALKEILGYSPEEVLGRRYEEFVALENDTPAKAMKPKLRKGKNTVQDFESRWIKKDGGIVHLSWAARWSEDKRLMYATARDITERYRAREALQKSATQINTVLESIGDGFFSVDRHWRITYANQKTAQFVGRTQEALTGKFLGEAVPEVITSSVYPHYLRAMETGEPCSFEEYYEPAHAWVDVRVYPHEEGLSVFYSDVSTRRAAQDALVKSEQRVREIIEMTPAGYFRADASAHFTEVNPSLCLLSGYKEDELLGISIMDIFDESPSNGTFFVKGGATAVRDVESSIRHKQGHQVHVLVNANIQRDAEGNALAFIAFITDITKRKLAEARFEQLATHDPLTGLPNRLLLNQRLQQILDSAPRNESNAVMFIDLDRFKEVNDSLGHKAGDVLLCEVAARLEKNLRPGDTVARLGGDEFVVVTHCSSGADSAAQIARKLLAALACPINVEGQEVFIGGSIGISMYPQDGKTKELLFQNADNAMYQAKAAGRNCYRFFTEAMSVESKSRLAVESALHRAIERSEFELYYQPRVRLSTLEVTGIEALIRWNHPQLGLLAPSRFISVAEECGLIDVIGEWVLNQACVQTQRLIAKIGRPLPVAVNLSPIQLKSESLAERISASLKRIDFPPHLLELELTEPALIKDNDQFASMLKSLASLGVRLVIDDFGTGHAGLICLRYVPVHMVKLDQNFVRQHVDGVNPHRFLQAVVGLAHALDLTVVAEGVEDEQTLQLLKSVRCDEVQGYFFARPMPEKDLLPFLADVAFPVTCSPKSVAAN
jgi:diguanylate cyclase (GGDEF)-like protein/PAS domain S-box-containing protein